MSTSAEPTTAAPTGSAAAAPGSGDTLRRLYLARFGFAIAWAVLFAVAASTLNPASVALLLIYPLLDVGAAVVDFRSSGDARSVTPLRLNMALSLLAAVGVAVAASSGMPAVLRVWGAWAITAGIVQLVVAIGRRPMGGQLPMMLSGGISVLAGASFAIQAGGPDPSLTALAGYATLGGIFFLVSALRLRRDAR